MIKKLLFFLFISLLCSCFAAAGVTNVRKDAFKNYVLSAAQQVSIGQPMIVRQDITYLEGQRFVGYLTAPGGYQQFREPTEDSFKEELIYSGRSGDAIHVTFREYRKSFDVPLNEQNLTYDLRRSDTVAFRNYRIEIIEATNEFIRYKILSDGGPAARLPEIVQ